MNKLLRLPADKAGCFAPGNDIFAGGFTLIELIVTMTVVAVLTTLAMISYGGTNKRARDGRRMSDLQRVAIALEMARQVGGTYPVEDVDFQAPYLITAGFLSTWPADPKGYRYAYNQNNNGYSYTLRAHMEDVGSTNGSWWNACGTSCNYRMLNP